MQEQRLSSWRNPKLDETASIWEVSYRYGNLESVKYQIVFSIYEDPDDTAPVYNSISSAERTLRTAGYEKIS